jgi:hypothetical protein
VQADTQECQRRAVTVRQWALGTMTAIARVRRGAAGHQRASLHAKASVGMSNLIHSMASTSSHLSTAGSNTNAPPPPFWRAAPSQTVIADLCIIMHPHAIGSDALPIAEHY